MVFLKMKTKAKDGFQEKAQTSRLLVAKAGRLVGIITARDLIQAIELAGRIGKIRDE